MPRKLYMMAASPPARAVLMVAKCLNINLEIVEINTIKRDQLKPDYLKINPQHTVPTLVDEDGFIIWDSHAIMVYLISKYAKDDSLYPKDIKKRAVVDQRLHFDSGVVFARIVSILKPMIHGNKRTIEQSDLDGVVEAYGFMEAFLKDKQFMAGDSVTIADFSLINSVATLDLIVPVDKNKYPRLSAWMKRVQALPVYEVNKEGYKMLTEIVKPVLP